jgi:nickel/cobalt exporter
MAVWTIMRLREEQGHHHHHHGDHGHDHAHDHPHHGHEDDDAHARAHAAEIEKRFAGRHVTTGQIVLFGLTGGLMPCPAAVSILIVCLQLKEFSLGFGIVAAFSLGLALTMISVGVLASWASRNWPRNPAGSAASPPALPMSRPASSSPSAWPSPSAASR